MIQRADFWQGAPTIDVVGAAAIEHPFARARFGGAAPFAHPRFGFVSPIVAARRAQFMTGAEAGTNTNAAVLSPLERLKLFAVEYAGIAAVGLGLGYAAWKLTGSPKAR